MALEILEQHGQRFVSVQQWPLLEWPGVGSTQALPTLTIKEDDLFMITDTLGNISGSLKHDQNTNLGLFCRDSRFLSRLELQIEGCSPILLSSNADKGFAISVLCANPELPDIPAETVGIQRDMVLNGGLFEDIEITNYNTQPIRFSLSLSFSADFVDIFEIRGYYKRPQRGLLLRQIPDSIAAKETLESPEMVEPLEKILELAEQATDKLTLAYQGLDGCFMESRIQFFHHPPDVRQGNTAIWNLSLQPHTTQKLGYRLQMLLNDKLATTVEMPATLGQAMAANLLEEEQWRQQATQIRSDNETLNQVITRAEQDIYLLRQRFDEHKILSAGVPWFSTLFGRDSLISASQTLILDPAIAQATLKLLACYQGKQYDEWREEQPGKILHELRQGELTRCGEVPHTPYYGTIDATPLWLMLYADYYAWTNDQATLEQLWPNALAAMDWIDAQRQQTGYLCYQRKSSGGLHNQGWKDSRNCIVNRYGEIAYGPIALCEVQAYAYAAKIRLSQIARLKKRIDLAEQWEEDARDLKHRFNRDFWVDDQDYCAIALDGEGKPVDGISSNPGHCLALGILDGDKAASVAERLLAPDLYNGWGIRTLSSDSPAYNPMGYHIGSVWPHDNSMIALGLRSLNLVDSSLEIAKGVIDMTVQQPYQRPPELFCGYDRIEGGPAVEYPVACSPQAWATGSIFQLLQMMLHLIPDASKNYLRILDPTLPDFINQLSIHNLRIGSTVLDLEFERSNGATACRVVRKRGNLRVVIET